MNSKVFRIGMILSCGDPREHTIDHPIGPQSDDGKYGNLCTLEVLPVVSKTLREGF
jgi:hypothetical protein